MNKKFINAIAEAMRQVDEKKKLDPVGKADADIDNDGDVDSSDEYLHNRRATIKKKMKHSKSGKLGHKDVAEASDEMDECPECGGSTENHDPDCSRVESSKKKKLEDDLDAKSAGKAMKHDCATHVASESWGYGECISGQHTLVEQEDGTAIVTHYDVMFEHGIEENVAVEDLTILREKSHMHASKQYMDRGKGKMANDGANKAATDAKARIKARAAKRAGMKESVFSSDKKTHHTNMATQHRDQAAHHETQMNKAKKAGAHPSEYDHHKVLSKMHNKAAESHGKAVVHSNRGEHDRARSHSQIANGHSDAVKKKAATYESYVQEAKQPGDSGYKKERMLDKFKGAGAKKMATDNGIDSPKVELDGVEIEKEKTAGVKQSPARGPADKLNVGDKKIVKPVKQGAK